MSTLDERRIPEKEKTPLVSVYADDPRVAPVVRGFVGRLPQRVRSLQEALVSKDWITLKNLAHQLKGAAGGYGFPSLTNMASELEIYASAKNPSSTDIEVLLETFNSECQRAQIGLTPEVKS